MKISKLFHYLYAALCFLPLLVIPAFMLAVRSDNNFQPITINTSGYEIKNKYETNEVNTLNDLQVGKVYFCEDFWLTDDLAYDNFSFTVLSGDLSSLGIYIEENYLVDFNSEIDTPIRFYCEGDSWFFDIFGNYNNINGSYIYFGVELPTHIYSFNFYIDDGLTDFVHYYQWCLNDEDIDTIPTASDFQVYSVEYNEGIVYNDTDIGSQLLYTCYVTTEKYMNFDEVLNLGAISDWIETNVFNNNVPLIWTIIWHYLDYWLLLSIFWLCFDVLIYVPQLAHRWLDKASLE